MVEQSFSVISDTWSFDDTILKIYAYHYEKMQGIKSMAAVSFDTTHAFYHNELGER